MGVWGFGSWGALANPEGASVLIPTFKWYSEEVEIENGVNDTITFLETLATPLTATITAGVYSWGELAYRVKTALEAAGASTYTVTYSHATRKYTITSDGLGGGGIFRLDVGATTDDALPTLGYTVDTTGALTYTSDTATPAISSLTATTNIRMPQLEEDAEREDTYVDSGRRESAFYGARERYTIRLEFETVATMQGLRNMWRQCGRYGKSLQFYPDSLATSYYVDCYWDAKAFRPREMTDRGAYRLFEIEMPLLFKVDSQTGLVTGNDLIDRRPKP